MLANFGRQFDVLVTPTMASLPPEVGSTHHDAASGLPVGVQVVALQVAAQLEQALPWRDRRPLVA